jgi:hypothetical protein
MTSSILLLCANCKKEFSRSLSEYKRQSKKGKRSFCCLKCASQKYGEEKRITWPTKNCQVCKKEFTTTKYKKQCCSTECSQKLCGDIAKKIWQNYTPAPKEKLARDDNWKQGRALSEELENIRRKRISDTMRNKKCGGLRRGSGRGKKGWYKGYWCDSSWELAWVIYQLEHNISFIRNEEKFEYQHKGKTRNYIPDFKIEDIYIEIKGYNTDQWQDKLSQFPHKLQILYKQEMKPILEYVIGKYGKNFVRLYGSVAEPDLLHST